MLKNKINRKIYIGQTVRPIHKRLEEHESGKNDRCRLIYRAIKKHGWDSFEINWYECPDEDLNFDEETLVREMETLSPDGYNLREGGGNRGKHSEESKQKMREAHLGKMHSDGHKQKNREAHLGKTLSDEHKKNIGKAKKGEKHPMYGKTHSEESKQKMSDARKGDNNHMYGKIPSEETRQKIREAHLGKMHSDKHKQKISEAMKGEKHHSSKRVYQYDLEGKLLGSFGTGEEAAIHLKRDDGSGIRRCANGGRKTAYGYIWKFD